MIGTLAVFNIFTDDNQTTQLNDFQNDVVENNKFQLNIDGYLLACGNEPSPLISVYENDAWRTANTQLPSKGQYFLDGKFIGYGLCDIILCHKIENPVEISLIEYVEIGKRESLEIKENQVPEFSTKLLNGRIKIELNYYSDNDCKNKETFTKILNRITP